jgi:hypothetical protein
MRQKRMAEPIYFLLALRLGKGWPQAEAKPRAEEPEAMSYNMMHT